MLHSPNTTTNRLATVVAIINQRVTTGNGVLSHARNGPSGKEIIIGSVGNEARALKPKSFISVVWWLTRL